MGFQIEAFSERIPPTASHFISGPLWSRRQGRIRSTKDLFGERTVKDREGGGKRTWREVQTPGHNWLFWKEKREKENWVGRPSDCSTTLNVSWPDQGNGTTAKMALYRNFIVCWNDVSLLLLLWSAWKQPRVSMWPAHEQNNVLDPESMAPGICQPTTVLTAGSLSSSTRICLSHSMSEGVYYLVFPLLDLLRLQWS